MGVTGGECELGISNTFLRLGVVGGGNICSGPGFKVTSIGEGKDTACGFISACLSSVVESGSSLNWGSG